MNPLDIGHAQAQPATAGPQSSWLENLESAFDISFNVDSMFGLEAQVQSRWEDSLRQYEKVTGQAVGIDASQAMVNSMIQARIDPNNQRFGANFFAQLSPGAQYSIFANPAQAIAENVVAAATQGQREEAFRRAQEFNEQIKALGNPSLKSFDDIVDEVIQARKDIIDRDADVNERGAWGSFLARIAGGVGGTIAAAVSGRDPIQAASLFVGGGGKNIAWKIGSEIAVNAAAEGVTQAVAIQPTSQLLGEPQQNIAEAVLWAGLTGGVVRGGIEGIGRLASRALARGNMELPSFDLRDEQLRQVFENNLNDPSARAGLSLLDDNAAFERANPYGDTTTGLRRFTGEIADIYDMMRGRTSTAIAHILEPEDFNLDVLDFELGSVRDRRPDLYDGLLSTTGRLAELDNQITDITSRIDNLSIVDAVGEVNAQAGARMAELQAQLADETLTPRQRDFIQRKIDEVQAEVTRVAPEILSRISELEEKLATPGFERYGKIGRNMARELDQLIKKAGERPLEDALDRIEAPMRSSLEALRKERTRAAADYRRARSRVDKEIARINAEQRVLEMAKPPTVQGPKPGEINPRALRADVVAAHKADIDLATENLEQTVDSTVASMRMEDGRIDLGDGQIADPDFRMEDPDNPGKEISFAQMLERIDDDARLVEAMRTCAV